MFVVIKIPEGPVRDCDLDPDNFKLPEGVYVITDGEDNRPYDPEKMKAIKKIVEELKLAGLWVRGGASQVRKCIAR